MKPSISNIYGTCSQFARQEIIHQPEKKVRVIRDWPARKSATEVRSFHAATCYRCFIRNFSSLLVPMTDCLKKKGAFIWIDEAGRTFELIKKKLTNAYILAFPN